MNNGGIPVAGGGGQQQAGMNNGGGDSPRHMRMYHPRHSPHARQR